MYGASPKESAIKLLKLINSARLRDTRAMYTNQLYFYTLAINNLNTKSRRQFIYKSIKGNKILRNTFNERSEDLYNENCETSLKEILKDLNKLEGTFICLKLIYRFNMTSTQISPG